MIISPLFPKERISNSSTSNDCRWFICTCDMQTTDRGRCSYWQYRARNHWSLTLNKKAALTLPRFVLDACNDKAGRRSTTNNGSGRSDQAVDLFCRSEEGLSGAATVVASPGCISGELSGTVLCVPPKNTMRDTKTGVYVG